MTSRAFLRRAIKSGWSLVTMTDLVEPPAPGAIPIALINYFGDGTRNCTGSLPGSISNFGPPKETTMLWTIAVILIILWAVGLVTAYTMGGFIHLLLVVAVIVILVRVIQGRRIL